MQTLKIITCEHLFILVSAIFFQIKSVKTVLSHESSFDILPEIIKKIIAEASNEKISNVGKDCKNQLKIWNDLSQSDSHVLSKIRSTVK